MISWPISCNIHNNYILKHPFEDKSGRRHEDLGRENMILSVFQCIIHGIYCKLNQERRTQMCCLCSFFHTVIVEYKEKKNNREENNWKMLLPYIFLLYHITIKYQVLKVGYVIFKSNQIKTKL